MTKVSWSCGQERCHVATYGHLLWVIKDSKMEIDRAQSTGQFSWAGPIDFNPVTEQQWPYPAICLTSSMKSPLSAFYPFCLPCIRHCRSHCCPNHYKDSWKSFKTRKIKCQLLENIPREEWSRNLKSLCKEQDWKRMKSNLSTKQTIGKVSVQIGHFQTW